MNKKTDVVRPIEMRPRFNQRREYPELHGVMAVETVRYEFSHGKKPRGYGRWFFETKDCRLVCGYEGLYENCKKAAMRNYDGCYDRLYVCP